MIRVVFPKGERVRNHVSHLNTSSILVPQEKHCAARVQAAFPHRDEGPQLSRHPAALHQLPRRLQRARRLPEAAAGRRVRCPSGLRGGSSPAGRFRPTPGAFSSPGSAHSWRRPARAAATGAAGADTELPQHEWGGEVDGWVAAAGCWFGDEVGFDCGRVEFDFIYY